MKMSEGVEWGLHCVTLLASLPEGAILRGKVLAEFHGVSETYLVKHLQALAAARILESIPGPKGGYRLVRKPEKITYLDVVEAIDGREPAFRCTEIRQRSPGNLGLCAYRMPCTINATMARAEKAWREVLRGETIADMVAKLPQVVDPRAQEKNAEWLKTRVHGLSNPQK